MLPLHNHDQVQTMYDACKSVEVICTHITCVAIHTPLYKYGCMDVWMYGCMDVWMYGCMDVWMYGCMCVLSLSLSIYIYIY